MTDILSFDDYIKEMASKFGDYDSRLHFAKNRKDSFEFSKNFKEYIRFSKNVVTTIETPSSNSIRFYTNDYETEETIHNCFIEKYSKNDIFKFDYMCQEIADRLKECDLPKNFATDFIYNYWKQSGIPLRSSKYQYDSGRNLWKRLIDKALNDGYHAYYYDFEKFLKMSNDNKQKYIDDYYGVGKSFEEKHLFISKKELA